LRDFQRAAVVSMEKTSKKLLMGLVKWTSILFMVTRLGMMTHPMTTISKVVCGLQFDDVPPVGHNGATGHSYAQHE
jgi:hypothetical protein